ncbi:bifunctional 5,10-methylene-tetrahydrofolate dehydrogenase/5,10-methylene-tetrahydrofolate cyclohydrolase [Candidatus Riesia sp. GBBU]|nr:bifunctional 5,10-methylene-tetrahydrofolate dehydrogenase/5,10-methylene-tetrahydrofolate cyclohydrolase [Candidatus Riesia sp. GBBU]
MTARILDGNSIFRKMKVKILKEIQLKVSVNDRRPGLAVIYVGKNPASEIYIERKFLAFKSLGLVFKSYNLEENVHEYNILKLIEDLNEDKEIDGIVVQLPVPKQINYFKIIEKINPIKDVEGIHPYNVGKFVQKNRRNFSCTSKGIITLLKWYKINISGMNAVVIGTSNIVGIPIGMQLLLHGCTITMIDKYTRNIHKYVKSADLLIVAIGKPNFIRGEWIKNGAVVIDVGINKLKNKIVGDVCYMEAKEKASWITPVPGGVGPMTIISLIVNVIKAFEKK